MASGSILGNTSNQYIKGRIDWVSTPNTEGNYSDVYFELRFSRTNTGYTTQGSGEYRLYSAWNNANPDTQYFYGYKVITYNSNTLFASFTRRVYHNTDGTMDNCYLQAEVTGGYPMSCVIGDKIVLDTIPRASKVNTSVDFDIGNDLTFNILRYTNVFTHKIILKQGNTIIAERTGINADSYILSLTNNEKDSLYQAVINTNNITINIIIETYSGQTLIGSDSKSGIAKVVNSNPEFTTFSFIDNNSITVAVTGNNSKIVKGQSTIRITCTSATAKNSATISKYRAVLGSKIVESNTNIIDFGTTDIGGILIVSAIDSRGNLTSVETAISIENYEPIITQSIKLNRTNVVEATTTLVLEGIYNNLTIGGVAKNSIQVAKYRYKETTSESWGAYTNITLTSTTSEFSYNASIGDFNVDKSYDIEFYVADKLTNYTISGLIPKAIPLVSYRKNKVGINCIPTEESEDGFYVDDGNIGFRGSTQFWPYTEATIPTGWIKMEGQAISRTTYKRLFDLIGTHFGSGDGSTTFNVPDMRGVVPVGYKSTDTDFDSIGHTGGAKTHSLTSAQNGPHEHGLIYSNNGKYITLDGGGSQYNLTWGTTGSNTGVNILTTVSGTGEAHNNLQPYKAFIWIIKY